MQKLELYCQNQKCRQFWSKKWQKNKNVDSFGVKNAIKLKCRYFQSKKYNKLNVD